MRAVSSPRESAFEVFYRGCWDDVSRYVTAHVGRDDVDDVVNATFTSVWQHFDDRPRASERAWVIGIARNHCRNRWRTDRRFSNLVGEIVIARPRINADLAVAGVESGVVSAFARLLDELSPEDRELLVLVGWLEMTPSEVAKVLGKRSGAVRVRLHRLRSVLRDAGIGNIEEGGAA